MLNDTAPRIRAPSEGAHLCGLLYCWRLLHHRHLDLRRSQLRLREAAIPQTGALRLSASARGAGSSAGMLDSGRGSEGERTGRLPLEPAKDLRYLYWRLTAAAERLPGSIAAMSAKGMEMEEASMMSLFSSGRKPFLVGTSDALSRDTVRGPLRGRYDSSSRSSSSCLPKSSRAAAGPHGQRHSAPPSAAVRPPIPPPNPFPAHWSWSRSWLTLRVQLRLPVRHQAERRPGLPQLGGEDSPAVIGIPGQLLLPHARQQRFVHWQRRKVRQPQALPLGAHPARLGACVRRQPRTRCHKTRRRRHAYLFPASWVRAKRYRSGLLWARPACNPSQLGQSPAVHATARS